MEPEVEGAALGRMLTRDDVALAKKARPQARPGFAEWLGAHPPAEDYRWGAHTKRIMCELEAVARAMENGLSRRIIITLPPRHGKSDLASRSFPAWALLHHPDWEVMLATYGAELSEGFSRAARRKFRESAPEYGLALARDLNHAGAWGVAGHRGALYAVGLGGAITGRGAHLLIVDDYCKNRAEAESRALRDAVWDSFRHDLLTRLAPAHAVLVVATRWHEDDLIGRILAAMASEPHFPAFEVLRFPAWSPRPGGPREPEPFDAVAAAARPSFPRVGGMCLPALAGGLPEDPEDEGGVWLFPERFAPAYYRAQRAALGRYAWEALYQCDPHPRAGRLWRADLVTLLDDAAFAASCAQAERPLRWVRGWDLASTGEERLKDDPDFTAGTLAATDGRALWVADVVRGRWSAPERDRIIEETAGRDGPGVLVRLETVAGYTDTFTRLRAALRGRALVRAAPPRGDKVARYTLLEPLFEGARVQARRGPWNGAWLAELAAIPAAAHDDQADSLVIAAAEKAGGERARLSA